MNNSQRSDTFTPGQAPAAYHRSNMMNHRHGPGPGLRDWVMTFKCYRQDAGKVYDQFTDLLAKLKKGREMLNTGKTGVDGSRPDGVFGIEKLRNTGRIVLEVTDEKGTRIAPPTIISAANKRRKFVNDEVTGLAVPAGDDDSLWRQSMTIAISVVSGAIRYVEIGKHIERARKNWNNSNILEPLASAICENMGILNLDGEGEEPGLLRGFLLSLVWPAVNGRAFASLEDGFAGKSVATDDGEITGGCWIYSWVPTVLEQAAQLSQKAEEDARVATEAAAASKASRKEMLAMAQSIAAPKSIAGPVPQPEVAITGHEPAADAVGAPQDAQAS